MSQSTGLRTKWLRAGMMLAVVVVLASACSPIPRPGAWRLIGSVPGLDAVDRMVPLKDGRVLILAGGFTQPANAPNNEIFDPEKKTFTPAAPNPAAFQGATVTELHDGSVLVVGGAVGDQAESAAYLYLPDANRWIAAGHMSAPRVLHTATLLADGRVLVVGGQNGQDALGSAEVFDPATRSWSATGSLSLPRTQGTAVGLPDGRVLIAGGYSNVGAGFPFGPTTGLRDYFAEIWSPATGEWSVTHDLPANPTLANLADGRVLSAGGQYGTFSTAESSFFEPNSGRWSMAANAPEPISQAKSALLGDGRLLLLASQPPDFRGAVAPGSPLTFDPSNNFWARASAYPSGFSPQDAVGLGNGTVLAVSGSPFNFSGLPPPHPAIAQYDPAGFPALPGSTGPLASSTLLRDLALAALGLLMLNALRIGILRWRGSRP